MHHADRAGVSRKSLNHLRRVTCRIWRSQRHSNSCCRRERANWYGSGSLRRIATQRDRVLEPATSCDRLRPKDTRGQRNSVLIGVGNCLGVGGPSLKRNQPESGFKSFSVFFGSGMEGNISKQVECRAPVEGRAISAEGPDCPARDPRAIAPPALEPTCSRSGRGNRDALR